MINVYADVNSDIVAIETSEKARKTILSEIDSMQDIDRMQNLLNIFIKESNRIGDEERAYLFNRLHTMNFQQRLQLLENLSTERQKLAILERQYTTANKITDIEALKQVFSGKTISWNKQAKYIRADGAIFYNDKNMGLLIGTWFIKNENICYQYIYSDQTFCYKVSIKGKQIFLNDQVITLKSGDTENLQEAFQKETIVTDFEEVAEIFSGQTMYRNGETVYTRADGIVFYNSKKGNLLKGKWFVKKNLMCYQYIDINNNSCENIFKKGKNIFINAHLITLKTGDTENLQEYFLFKSIK